MVRASGASGLTCLPGGWNFLNFYLGEEGSKIYVATIPLPSLPPGCPIPPVLVPVSPAQPRPQEHNENKERTIDNENESQYHSDNDNASQYGLTKG